MVMLTVLWQPKSTVSFSLEDKCVVNEHHIIRKSHDATQKKLTSPHMMYFNVLCHCLKESHSIKNITLKVAKKFVGVAVYCKE